MQRPMMREYQFWCMECEQVCIHWLMDVEIECSLCHQRTPVVPFITMLSSEVQRITALYEGGGAYDG